jgi:hypothetical protein
MDIIRGVVHGIKKAATNRGFITVRYIRGHQDRNNSQLSDLAKLNVQADTLATLGLKQHPTTDVYLSTDRAVLWIDNKKVGSKFTKHLRNKFSSIQMYSHYQDKYKWTDNTLKAIWWEAHGKALYCYSTKKQTIIQKFIHERIACNSRESKYYLHRSPHCHLCKESIEDHNHILKCKMCSNRNLLRKKFIMQIGDKLKLLGTNQDSTRLIIMSLTNWLDNKAHPNIFEVVPDASSYLVQAMKEQSEIGWDQWFRGRISNTWGYLYQNDVQNGRALVNHPSADKWGKEVITITWNFVLECWFERNCNEHDSKGDPITRAKQKMTDEIMWHMDQKEEEIPSQYLCTTTEELLLLPQQNLKIMLEQMKKVQNTL